MTDTIAIGVKNVTKTYRLYNSHADRVKEAFHPLRKKYHYPFNALNNVSFDVKKGEAFGHHACAPVRRSITHGGVPVLFTRCAAI